MTFLYRNSSGRFSFSTFIKKGKSHTEQHSSTMIADLIKLKLYINIYSPILKVLGRRTLPLGAARLGTTFRGVIPVPFLAESLPPVLGRPVRNKEEKRKEKQY
jgi:hypothetical protein